jgi:uncharacterized membrane protein
MMALVQMAAALAMVAFLAAAAAALLAMAALEMAVAEMAVAAAVEMAAVVEMAVALAGPEAVWSIKFGAKTQWAKTMAPDTLTLANMSLENPQSKNMAVAFWT